jgi:predicted nucleic acid-binding protein
MKVVVDTGPLLAAANPRDRANELARKLLRAGRSHVLVPLPVLAEVDYMVRTRVGPRAARRLLAEIAGGVHTAVFMTPGLLRRAAEIDARHGDLGLGVVDSCVMAYAERHDLPILTFDFAHFRAAASARGYWRMIIDERRYAEATK